MAANKVHGKAWPVYFQIQDQFREYAQHIGRELTHNHGDEHKLPRHVTSNWVAVAATASTLSAIKTYFPNHYVQVDLWGIVYHESNSGEVTFKEVGLLVKESDFSEGRIEAADVTFYYVKKHEHWLELDRWDPHEYKEYVALETQEIENWKLSQSALGEIGSHEFTDEQTQAYAYPGGERVDPDWQNMDVTVPASQKTGHSPEAVRTGLGSGTATKVYVAANGKWDRIASKLEQDRIAMDEIAKGQKRTGGHPVSISSIDIQQRIKDALLANGYSLDQISWFHNPTVNPLGANPGTARKTKTGDSKTGGSGSLPPKVAPPTPAVTRMVVRAPVGYTKPAGRGEDMRPHMVQVGSHLDEPDRYYFRHIPNTVSYSGLGSRWVEIPRKGDFPIVEFSDWALMKVQFEFLVAHEMDGMFSDVSEEIDQLRRMAQRPLPVSVFGMDRLFSLQMKRAKQTGRAMQFVIANFTVRSARRTVLEGLKEITTAQCSMTLQEIPIEEMKVVEMKMPPLTGSGIPGPSTDGDVSSNNVVSQLPEFVHHAPDLIDVTNTSTAVPPGYGIPGA